MESFSLETLSASSAQVLPMLVLLGTGLLLMMLDAFNVRKPLPWVAALGLLASGAMAYFGGSSSSSIAFFGMMETGGIAPLVHLFFCIAALFTLFFLQDYLGRQDKNIPDVYALLVFAVLGMILFANANDLIMTFIGLETMSICLYIFAALYKTELRSNESGLKYFLLGAFASAFMLFGISLIYGITGYTNFSMLAQTEVLEKLIAAGPLFYVASGLVLVGFLFKVAAFPFHNWTPDVYTGTPTPLAGFMATAGKLAAFVALGVFLQKLDISKADKIIQMIALASLFTMIYGNIVAARQSNIKRMLAYSSVAHSGYLLLGLTAPDIGFQAVVFYMLIYTLMNIGAFGMVGMAEYKFEDTEMESWKGLGKSHPWFAGGMALFLFSLAGIPPLAGFMSKYQVFTSVIQGSVLESSAVFLTTVAILTSVVGAYYYIRLIVMMFFQDRSEESNKLRLNFNQLATAGVIILALLIVILGVFPSLVLSPIDQAFAGSTEGIESTVTALSK
ncbi:MAG: NADH-quinone oxidoreductase subunit N [Bacteroidia bacterium]|nr:NADH-quinone oxidoreductase subunit N [Bacteroidia bacterium]